MDILWVTSFNRQLFEASGKKLIQTFHDTNTTGDLLLACENGVEYEQECRECLTCDLEGHPTLTNWLARNIDIIPGHLGGVATECDCPVQGDKLAPGAKHRRGCHWAWFNRICSRWFRKLPAIEVGMQGEYDAVVWIDSDCFFRKQVTANDVMDLFSGQDVFYLKGPYRKVPECGVVGYNLQGRGREFFREFLDCYQSGIFRQLERWDDSYVFDYVRQNGVVPFGSVDLASPRHGRNGHVVEHSRIGPWIGHDKGKHGRVMRIMDDL